MMTEKQQDEAAANRPDATGAHRYHHSLIQRVFIEYHATTQPMDREHIRLRLAIGDLGLDHAIRRLLQLDCITSDGCAKGSYKGVPGAVMPADTRGRNPNSHGNRGKAANGK